MLRIDSPIATRSVFMNSCTDNDTRRWRFFKFRTRVSYRKLYIDPNLNDVPLVDDIVIPLIRTAQSHFHQNSPARESLFVLHAILSRLIPEGKVASCLLSFIPIYCKVTLSAAENYRTEREGIVWREERKKKKYSPSSLLYQLVDSTQRPRRDFCRAERFA